MNSSGGSFGGNECVTKLATYHAIHAPTKKAISLRVVLRIILLALLLFVALRLILSRIGLVV